MRVNRTAWEQLSAVSFQRSLVVSRRSRLGNRAVAGGYSDFLDLAKGCFPDLERLGCSFGTPPPSRSIGIIRLGRNRKVIYGAQSVAGKSWCKRTYTRRAHAPLPFWAGVSRFWTVAGPQSSRHLIDKLFCFQYLTSKLLQMRWLVKTWCERKFSLESRKILLSNNLAGGASHQASQILEPLRLPRKILRSNDLASTRRRRPSPLGIRNGIFRM